MATSLSSISGLISGFNYTDLVDAIIAQARQPAVRMEADLDDLKAKAAAIGTYRGLLDTLRTAAATLSGGTAFDATSATLTTLTGSRAVATVVTSAAATAQTFTLKVSTLARAEKLSSTGVPDAAAVLGGSGTFTVNGQAVAVTGSETLLTLRDKINALNSGATPTGVTASVLSVSATDNRLVLTSAATGAAGIALADTAGTTLQGLGFLDSLGAKPASAVIVAGSNANFTIDDVPLTRTTNQITDAIEGVTLNLVSEEAGASTQVEVGRFADAAKNSMKAFVDAYNGVVGFLKQQGTITTTRPALYGDAILRTARSALPEILLQTVGGAASDLATAGRAGVSLTRDGTLTLDEATFTTAFRTRYDDVRALFTERRTSSTADLTFVSSGASAEGGSRAVSVTALATSASIVTSGFSGLYDDGGTADTLTVSESGLSVDVTLSSGMTTDDIVGALQDAFDGAGLGLTAVAEGNDIRITQNSYGSAAGIGLAVTGTGDGASEAWSGPATAAGTDIQGTIDGESATGAGQTLVGNGGTLAAGISVLYGGASLGAVGSVTLGLGTGARIERLLDAFLQTGTGSIAQKLSSYDIRAESLTNRVTQIDARLERRRAMLLQNFLQMETAISRLKQQSASLLGSTTSSSSSGS